jgi:hypothetical protein
MRRLPALAATAAALLVLTHPSAAAAQRFHIADATGDANGTNSQEIGLPVPSVATGPAEVAGADITGIDLVNRYKGTGRLRKPSGFDVVLHLAAPLQQGIVITVTMTASASCGDSSTIQLGAGTSSLAVCQASKPTGKSITVGTMEVAGDRRSITWTIDNVFKAGTRISDFYASSSVFVLGVFDEAESQATFTYGR